MATETVVIQIKNGVKWTDYARTSPKEAMRFLDREGNDTFRAVDWMTWKPVHAVCGTCGLSLPLLGYDAMEAAHLKADGAHEPNWYCEDEAGTPLSF